MENNNLLSRVACAIICLLFAHCAVTHESANWLPRSENVPSDPYGAWIEVKTQDGQVYGELIAVSTDTVYVVNTSLHALDKAGIQSARVVFYNSNDVSGGIILGPLLTISNGFFLVLTAPM